MVISWELAASTALVVMSRDDIVLAGGGAVGAGGDSAL
jgi:hypothetical protein